VTKIDSQLWSKSKDIITIILIPSMIWIVSIISEFKTDQHKINTNIEKIDEIKKEIQTLDRKDTEISIQIARIETSIGMISKDIDEIKRMLLTLSKE
jgi:uncharacterized coiled-coil DUF342 family protein